MKALICTCFVASIFASCKTETSPQAPQGDSTGSNFKFAYTIKHPADNWQPGNLKHVETFLNALKAFEKGDIADCVQYFGDTVKLQFDGLDTLVAHKNLASFFGESRKMYGDLIVKMDDWESVISKDKKTEYVSVWYKQVWTTAGKTDSLDVMNDAQIKDGKIITLSEKVRHFQVK